jgi:hypothetical protein
MFADLQDKRSRLIFFMRESQFSHNPRTRMLSFTVFLVRQERSRAVQASSRTVAERVVRFAEPPAGQFLVFAGRKFLRCSRWAVPRYWPWVWSSQQLRDFMISWHMIDISKRAWAFAARSTQLRSIRAWPSSSCRRNARPVRGVHGSVMTITGECCEEYSPTASQGHA